MVWDPYNDHLVRQPGGQQQQQLQPQQGPAQYQQQCYPEEQIEFDYNQYTQDAQPQPFLLVTQKTPPNLTKIQNGLKANEKSTSESAGEV
jgi:hypothetical protein